MVHHLGLLICHLFYLLKGSLTYNINKCASNPLFARLYVRSSKQTDSVCLEDTKKMPPGAGGALAGN